MKAYSKGRKFYFVVNLNVFCNKYKSFLMFICIIILFYCKGIELKNINILDFNKSIKTVKTCIFKARVHNILLLKEYQGKYIITTSDPKYIVDVDSIQIQEGDYFKLTNNNNVFTIHSPLKTFGQQSNEIVGKYFLFKLEQIEFIQTKQLILRLNII